MPLEFGTLEAQIATGDTVDFRFFQVEEGLSRLLAVHLEVVSPNPDIELDAVVGQPASFSLRQEVTGGVVRTWSGVCQHIEQLVAEDSATGRSTYAIEIVPRAWFLTQRRNHRIFQQKSEPQIALALLEEWSVDVETELALEDYPTRDYRVQFAESDFAFLSRLLEDAGITYYFEHRDDRMVMVLSDEPTARSPRPSLRFVETPMTTDQELVTGVRIVRRVRPGRYTQRDVDYRRPPTFPVVASQEGGLDAERPPARLAA